MHASWKSWLSQVGARINNEAVEHFGDPMQERYAAIRSDTLCDLSHYGLIAITGTDKIGFCQGQFTNDASRVTPEHSLLTAYCSPKGRMLACFRMFQRADNYYLRLPQDVLESTLKRLRMYVLRADAKLGNSSTDLIGLGFSGPNTEALLKDALGQVPAAVDSAMQIDSVTLLRIPGPYPRFELYLPPTDAENLWHQFSTQTQPVGLDAWRLLNIRAGIPDVYPTTIDAFVPQMANLDLLDGISFDKGCYVGQEIVARTHYLGRLKRRMYRIRCNTESMPAAGTDLFAPDARGDQSIGRIVDACLSPDGGCEALAVLVIECVEQGSQLRLNTADGHIVDIDDLPYNFVTS